ncbi:MAG: glycosyltransferase family 9 protein [Chloroflexia bacterium]|nr:glycosyltransferase family 9 protein [Chloroflexia bacterium]
MIVPQWAAARRLLVVRLDNLGDVLVTTPAIHALRRALPAAHIALLASATGAQAGRLNPDLDETIVYEAPWMDPWQTLLQDSAREERTIARLREGAFDAAVIFTSFRQSPLPSAYLCYLANIPLRLAASIDGPGSLLTSRHKHPTAPMHETERGLDLVAAVGIAPAERDLVLAVPTSSRRAVEDGGWWVADGPRVVVHPGCTMPARTYPWEGFAAVIERLVRDLGASVVVTGTESERELVERVVATVPAEMRDRVRAGAGELAFAEFCALIEAADLTVTNNTGPMHVAAAVKTPVVALFAWTNPPEQWGPWMVPHRLLNHDVPCKLCYARVCPYTHDCLRLVTPEQVVAAGAELLAAAPAPPRPALSRAAR